MYPVRTRGGDSTPISNDRGANPIGNSPITPEPGGSARVRKTYSPIRERKEGEREGERERERGKERGRERERGRAREREREREIEGGRERERDGKIG